MTTAVTSTIAIECTCGRRGFIAARLAGRKVRCTGCGQPVRVPSASSSDVSATVSDEPLTVTVDVPPPAPARGDALDLLPEVTRTFHDPAALAHRRHAAVVADEAPRKRRASTGHRRDPDWERHLRAIAFWPLLSGVLGLPLLFVGALLLLVSQVPLGMVLAFALAAGGVSAVYFAAGYFLWTYNGIARLLHLALSGAMTALGLIALVQVPGALAKLVTLLELAWPAAIFAVLMDPRAAAICTEPYRKLVRKTPAVSVAWWTSPFFYLPIVLMLFAAILIGSLVASAGVLMR